jgi:uncharacterized membrane protein required for colicin V production
MWLDIGICVMLAVCLGLGWFRGLMCGILGFVSGAISFAIAIFSAKPIAKLADNLVHLSKAFNKIGHGEGFALSILACGAVVYAVCRILFWVLSRCIKRLKKENRAIDVLDRVGGVALGAAKFVLAITIFFVVIFILSVIPFIADGAEYFFKGSHIGQFIYDTIVRWFGGYITAYAEAIIDKFWF